MTETRKKVMEKGGLVVLGAIVVILVVSNIWTYTNLQSQITNLSNEKNALTSEKASLQSQVTSFQNQLNDLNAIVNLQKSQVLDRDKTVNLAAGKDATLSYSTAYAGYVTISFTATTGVYFWVQSSFTGTNYARYPSTSPDTATSGSFTIPVTKGTTYLYIRNPALLFGASVTFTITYVY